MLSIIEKNSIIGIEEPEIHLHPKAQSDLAKILIDVSQKNNQQIIFTTHSEHMLYPILTSIVSKQKNSLTKEQVGIYYFDIDENDRTHCEELKIDDYGRIKGGLKGFFEENVNSLTEYLDALKFSEKAKK